MQSHEEEKSATAALKKTPAPGAKNVGALTPAPSFAAPQRSGPVVSPLSDLQQQLKKLLAHLAAFSKHPVVAAYVQSLKVYEQSLASGKPMPPAAWARFQSAVVAVNAFIEKNPKIAKDFEAGQTQEVLQEPVPSGAQKAVVELTADHSIRSELASSPEEGHNAQYTLELELTEEQVAALSVIAGEFNQENEANLQMVPLPGQADESEADEKKSRKFLLLLEAEDEEALEDALEEVNDRALAPQENQSQFAALPENLFNPDNLKALHHRLEELKDVVKALAPGLVLEENFGDVSPPSP